MKDDFVRQPLLKKLNRENLITRIIKLERQNGARASQSAGQLGHISGRTGILYVDELIAGEGNVVTGPAGIQISAGGLLKVDIQSDGDIFVGDNAAVPADTSLAAFVNSQTYNGESMIAGDLLIGPNQAGYNNVLISPNGGFTAFRYGTLQLIIVNGGAGAMEFDKNVKIFFGDSANDFTKIAIGSFATNNLELLSTAGSIQLNTSAAGQAVQANAKMTNGNTKSLNWGEVLANAPTLFAYGDSGGILLNLLNSSGATSIAMWGGVDSKETVINEDSYDIDFRIESANLTKALSIDAGLDKATSFMWDGWAARDETWTRTGNHTFTISSATDLTPVFRKGTKIRYQDGGGSDEYGVVGSSTFAASTTTVNLIPNTDYAMAAATITAKYISYIENPEGFPDWFNFDANPQGFSVVPPTPVYRFKVQSNMVQIDYLEATNGTSNATTFTASLPIAAVYTTAPNTLGTTVDNTAIQTTPGRLVLTAASTTITFRKDTANAAWTNAGGKRAIANFVYEY